MRYKMLPLILIMFILSSGCSKSYNGPYAYVTLITKDAVKMKINSDKSLITSKSAPLLKQVQAKSDIKFYQMLLDFYEYYELQIKNVDGKKYIITASSINKLIKDNKYSTDLKMIESDETKWPALFLGNLSRYFDSLGFVVYADPTNKQENIVINW